MTRALHRSGLAAFLLASLTAACTPAYLSNPAPARPANPTPVPAAVPTPLPVPTTPRDRLIAAVEQSGCLVTRDNRDAVISRANMSLDEFAALTRELQSEGRVEVPPGGTGTIRLLSANCI